MEAVLIHWLRKQLPPDPRLLLGIGDDAAVLQLVEPAQCVVTSDLLMDGTDFVLRECDPRRAGRKALAVNLSDLAAMAAKPVAAIVSLALPKSCALSLARELYHGILPLAKQYDTIIAGGDTNTWDGPLAISITAIGEVTDTPPLRRNGARSGDIVIVTGKLGGSILGKHFDFTPRVNEALRLTRAYEIHAATDISDGLSLDLANITSESGCGAVLDLASVPIAEAAHRLAEQTTQSPIDHALSDGEDFELILSVPPTEAERLCADRPLDIPLTAIGTYIEEPGLWYEDMQGGRVSLPPRGYRHEGHA